MQSGGSYVHTAAIDIIKFVPKHARRHEACYVGLGMSDLIAWLDGWGLKQLGPRLAEQDIDLDALKYLTEEDLKELGLTIGLRRRLSHAIEEGFRRPAPALVPPAPGAPPPTPPNCPAHPRLPTLFSDLP